MTNLFKILVLALLVCNAYSIPIDTESDSDSDAERLTGVPLKPNAEPLTIQTKADAEPLMVPTKADAEPLMVPTKADAEPLTVPTRADAEPLMVPTKADAEPLTVPTKADAEPLTVPTKADAEPLTVPTRADAEPLMVPTKADAEPLTVPTKADAEPLMVPTNADAEPLIAPLKSEHEALVGEVPLTPVRPDRSANEEEMPFPEHLISGMHITSMLGNLNTTQISPCESHEFKYYQPHNTDIHKYFECDPWGSFLERVCENGTIWDNWALRCSVASQVRNFTSILLPEISSFEMFNCTLPLHTCHNQGVCQFEMNEYRCVCPSEFTGEICDIKVTEVDIFNNIMSGNFTLNEYIQHLMSENITMDISYYEKYRTILEPVVFTKLMSYLSQYNKTLIRYDTLINSLVEDILVDIYPDADFLRTLNVSTQTVINLVHLIPNLLSFAKYSAERYDVVFMQFEHVLEQVWLTLNTTHPELRQQAISYVELTELFLNETIHANKALKTAVIRNRQTGRNIFLDPTQLTEVSVRELLRTDFNETLVRANSLFGMLAEYERAINIEFKKNPAFIHEVISNSTLTGSVDFVRLFTEVETLNTQIWDTLVSYGYWFITRTFITPVMAEDMQVAHHI